MNKLQILLIVCGFVVCVTGCTIEQFLHRGAVAVAEEVIEELGEDERSK